MSRRTSLCPTGATDDPVTPTLPRRPADAEPVPAHPRRLCPGGRPVRPTFPPVPGPTRSEQIREYLLHLIRRGYAWDTYNQARCALHFFYRVTLGKDWPLEHLPCAKVPKRLPVVLSRDEVRPLFAAARRPKGRAMLLTAYAAGLRASEVVGLRVEDIDSRRMLIRVRQGRARRTATSCSRRCCWRRCGRTGSGTARRADCSPARTRPSRSGGRPSLASASASVNTPGCPSG